MTAVHLGTTAAETGPHGGRPVAGLIAPLIRRVIVLGLLLAGIAAAGVLAALSSVSNLADDLQPAAAANHAVLQDVSDMQSAARFWARTGDSVAIDDYRQAETRLPGHESDVRRFAENDADLEALVDRQSALAEEYLTGSAEPRLARPGRPRHARRPPAGPRRRRPVPRVPGRPRRDDGRLRRPAERSA
jgi:two-component system, OmpR family, sensor kinase